MYASSPFKETLVMQDDYLTDNSPLISVIIPVFNGETYLEECIQSVLDQTYPKKEIIIVDDGSTDGSDTIETRYAKSCPNCVSVIRQNQSGAYEARKTGMRASRGDYLLFLDSDDVLRNTALEILSGKANDEKADIILFVPSGRSDFSKDGTSNFYGQAIGEDLHGLRELLISTDIANNLCFKMIKRDCLVGLINEQERVRLSMAEDKLACCLVLDKARSVSSVDEVLYYYRPNEMSTTHYQNYASRMADLFFVKGKIEPFLRRWDMQSDKARLDALLVSQLVEEVFRLSSADVCIDKKEDILAKAANDCVFRSSYNQESIVRLKYHRRVIASLIYSERYRSALGLSSIMQKVLVFVRNRG